jgi:hypothetical protein
MNNKSSNNKTNSKDIIISILIGFLMAAYTNIAIGKENITTEVFILQLISTVGLISMYNYYCFKKRMINYVNELKNIASKINN